MRIEAVAAQEPGEAMIDIHYRFAPGEPGDGATLHLPLLAVPVLSGALLDAAVPGFAAPRIEALLRSLPKDARRGLIPIAGTAAAYLAWTGPPGSDPQRLARWLMEQRGVAAELVRFEPGAVPAYLRPQLVVIEAGAQVAAAPDLETVRRTTAPRTRTHLDALAETLYPGPWRRFEADSLPSVEYIHPDGDAVTAIPVFPALGSRAEITGLAVLLTLAVVGSTAAIIVCAFGLTVTVVVGVVAAFVYWKRDANRSNGDSLHE